MYYSKLPNISAPLNDLLHDDSSLSLTNVAAHLEQHSQVIPICVLLHHVYIGACFNCLVKADGMIAPYHSVNLYLLVDTIEVFLTDI